ncbi:type III secretion system export apparatus subunit SctV [Roseiconus lacunae]|uniref:type III secretion system export apparatus subunit SctV n=1 Tax=Roseiconus lacunae TaxID=2605694 RepID=UPI001E5BA076|nr:type III secretion system export apparatus subunit SctV [Roseiconus lacunae]MCD0457864.1 type III secretion system export apparatus subunit SctV [Roseiconus lacunae]
MSLHKMQSAAIKITQYSDLFLAGLIVAVISLMVLPLPTVVVDTLLAANLGLAVTLLMMSMYIKSVLSFSTFPSLLLFTTLLRLSLNITTTRLILLEANAGEVIDTFGNFVVAGNLVVGAVIFLIITIVQFLVIAKGSERVAEVAARFTLDAMPGKQMSIDADMRAGVIDIDQARERRSLLAKESQLYGAMDGAMKFVKGDAIAGIIITAVNIVGGLIVGVTLNEMTAAKALQTYSILTIGDGLVSQIPALLISITAGIIVTRVTSDDSPALGGDIGQQLLAQPKALLLGGGLLLLFSLVPGFPKLQFLALGGVVAFVGFAIQRATCLNEEDDEHPVPAIAAAGQKPPKVKTDKADDFSLTVPLILDVAASIEQRLNPKSLNEELIKVRRALYQDLGVPFPGIHLRYNSNLPEDSYQILLQEIPVAQGNLKPGHLIARERLENLELLGLEITREEQFLPDVDSLWVQESNRDELVEAGIPILEPAQILTHHLSYILRRYAGEFLGLQETKVLLDNLDERFGELVKEVMRVMPIQKISEVLQRLVQEEISIRNLRVIMQALIDWGQKEKDTVLLAEYVRSSLKRYISYKYSGGNNVLAVYLLEQNAEETIRKAIRQTSGGSFLALDPDTTTSFVQTIKHKVGDLSQAMEMPCLLTSMDVRRYVKRLLELEIPNLPVLSYQELVEEISLQPLAKIDF